MLFINKKRNRLWWFVAVLSLMSMSLLFFVTRPPPSDPTDRQPARVSGAPQPMLNAMTTNASTVQSLPTSTTETHKPVTALRAKLWDTTDVMTSVLAARSNGTADEKGWAADLLRECYGYVDQPRPEQYSNPGTREAWDELAKRCAGVKSIPMGERHAIVAELYAGAKLSTSALHELQQVNERQRRDGDNRWTNVEADAITSALHGVDPLVRREAFNLLLEAIDNKAPGGEGRREALLFAMAGEMLNQPLSDFEHLQRCVMLPNCEQPPRDSSTMAPTGTLDEREGVRLRAAYAEAFAKRLQASEILAIR